MGRQRRYIYALGHDRLTPLYDAVIRRTVREAAFKRRLVARAHIRPADRVLDLGCGTGTLLVLLKRSQPGATAIGIDGDPRVLGIARRKAEQAGIDVSLSLGLATDLPYADATFDHVLCSLVFHHLSHEDKVLALGEVARVLRSGGSLHMADFGPPRGMLMQAAAVPWRLFDGWANTADNVAGRLPVMIRDAGLGEARESARFTTLFGTLSLLTSVRSSPSPTGPVSG